MNPLKKLRAVLGVTQQQLAASTDLSISSVANWERGSVPEERSLRILVDLARKHGQDEVAGELQSWRNSTAPPIRGYGDVQDIQLGSSVSPEARAWLVLIERAITVRDPIWREMLASVRNQIELVAQAADIESKTGPGVESKTDRRTAHAGDDGDDVDRSAKIRHKKKG